MDEKFDIQAYLARGVENVVSGALRATLRDPRESAFMPHGGAEPCPFSPYSDVNVRDTSLRQALASPLFNALREGELLADDHAGGCVLFEKRAAVEAILAK